jgi:hypothetical protein
MASLNSSHSRSSLGSQENVTITAPVPPPPPPVQGSGEGIAITTPQTPPTGDSPFNSGGNVPMPPPGPPPPGPPAAPPMAPAPPMPPTLPMVPAGPPMGVPNPPPAPPMAPVAPPMPPNFNNQQQFPPTSMGYSAATSPPFPPTCTSTPSHTTQQPSPPGGPPMPPQQQQQQFPPPPPANFPPPPDAYFAAGQMHNRPLPPVPDHQYDIMMVSPAMSVSPSQASLSSHQSTESSRSISPPVGPRSSPGQNRPPLTSLQEESGSNSLQAALVNKLQLRQRSRSIEDQQPPNIKFASLQRGGGVPSHPSMVHQMTMPAGGPMMMGNAPPVAHKPPRHGNRSISRSNTVAGPSSAIGKQ